MKFNMNLKPNNLHKIIQHKMCANCNKQHFNLDVSFESNFSLFILLYLSYHININVSEWTHFLIFKCFHKCGVFFKLFRLHLCNWDRFSRCFELCLSDLANFFNKIKYELPSLKLLQYKCVRAVTNSTSIPMFWKKATRISLSLSISTLILIFMFSN